MARSGKRIVLTGATGLIGPKLARRLISRGDEVIALVRDPEAGRKRIPEATQHLKWSSSMTDGEWAKAIDGADAVINLAGSPVASRWTAKQKESIRQSRIGATKNLVDAIARAERPPGVLINGSAVGYYGTSETEVFTESSPPGNDFLGKTCEEWEREAERVRTFGVRVVLLRTGIVLDPDGGALGKLLPTFRLGLGGPLGSGEQWFPWIHIQDELDIILWALDNEDVDGPINAVAPGIVTNVEFSSLLGALLGRPAIFAVPAFALKLVFGGGAVALTEGQQVIPARTEELGYRFTYPMLNEALRNLL